MANTNVTISNDKEKLVADVQVELLDISELIRVKKLSVNPVKNKVHDQWSPVEERSFK